MRRARKSSSDLYRRAWRNSGAESDWLLWGRILGDGSRKLEPEHQRLRARTTLCLHSHEYLDACLFTLHLSASADAQRGNAVSCRTDESQSCRKLNHCLSIKLTRGAEPLHQERVLRVQVAAVADLDVSLGTLFINTMTYYISLRRADSDRLGSKEITPYAEKKPFLDSPL